MMVVITITKWSVFRQETNRLRNISVHYFIGDWNAVAGEGREVKKIRYLDYG